MWVIEENTNCDVFSIGYMRGTRFYDMFCTTDKVIAVKLVSCLNGGDHTHASYLLKQVT